MTPSELSLLRDLLANHQTAVMARFNATDQHAAQRFDNVDDRVEDVKRRLEQLSGRVRKVEQSNTRLKVVTGGLIALAFGWLKTTLHF